MKKVPKFDKQAFEDLMDRSIQLQREGVCDEALELNLEAYEMAPVDSFEKGRAARDTAARLDRLGNADEAERFAFKGFAIHNQLVEDTPSREGYRERSASAMFMGVVGLRRAIRAQQAGDKIEGTEFIDYLRSTLEDLRIAKAQALGINRAVDQYQINATRRVSIAESLFGERKNGVILGMQAVALAFMSESPDMDTANPNLTLKERLLTKERALLGGIAALSVSVLASADEPRRHALALRIADKTI